MPIKEIKYKISEYSEIRKVLEDIGAVQTKILSVKDTYFEQPTDKVLKLTQDEEGCFLVRLEKNDSDEFVIIERKKLGSQDRNTTLANNKIALSLRKKRIFYKIDGIGLNINTIENIGDFLIFEYRNENQRQRIKELSPKLDLQDKDRIKVPFFKLAGRK